VIPAEVPVGLPSELLQRRPDIRQAEAQLHAATAQIGAATADLYPKFALTGSVGILSPDFSGLGTIANNYWSFGGLIQWNVFNGGRIRGNIEIQAG
jgi:outer membrane protein TolC